jgi:hypothetical protein
VVDDNALSLPEAMANVHIDQQLGQMYELMQAIKKK